LRTETQATGSLIRVNALLQKWKMSSLGEYKLT
jgi:hypothetical protein